MMVLLVALARAADPPAFAGADVAGAALAGAAPAPPKTRLAAVLGGAFTSGNTSTYTLNAGVDADHRWARNKLGIDAGANLGRSVLDTNADGKLDEAERAAGWAETAKKAWIEPRYDRYVGARDSLYVLAGTLIDPFAGYDNRSHAQLGYSRVVYTQPRTQVVVELGADGAREDRVEGVEPAEVYVVSARVMLGLTHTFNDNVSFTNKLEVYESIPELLDVRVLNQASILAKLSTAFSLKLSHDLTFDNAPVEGFQPLDHTTTVTFVASIL